MFNVKHLPLPHRIAALQVGSLGLFEFKYRTRAAIYSLISMRYNMGIPITA